VTSALQRRNSPRRKLPQPGRWWAAAFHAITIAVTDSSEMLATCTTTFTVADTTAPVISSVAASPNVLNRRTASFVPVTVSVADSDNCESVSRLPDHFRDEQRAGNWPRRQDFARLGHHGNLTVNLRAERAQKGNGTDLYYHCPLHRCIGQ